MPEPHPGIHDVLIKVRRAAICGTCLHIYVPMAVRHEFVGQVVEAVSNVSDFFPGGIDSAEGHVVRGRCSLAARPVQPGMTAE